MPRLTNLHYLAIHTVLRRYWLTDKADFGYLTLNDQSALHDFYRPADNLTDAALITHRKTITAQQPSLPSRAGKAVGAFSAVVSAEVEPPARITVTEHKRTLSVRAVRRPQPDLAKFHAALTHYVMNHPDLGADSPDATQPRAA